MIIGMMLAAAAATTATERISVDHAGRTMAAQYSAELAVSTKQAGSLAGSRMGTRRCDWTASVTVRRTIAGQDGASIAALSRTVADDQAFSGSRMGECDTMRRAIEAEAARRDDRLRTHLAQAIAADRPQLMAELDSIGPASAVRAR